MPPGVPERVVGGQHGEAEANEGEPAAGPRLAEAVGGGQQTDEPERREPHQPARSVRPAAVVVGFDQIEGEDDKRDGEREDRKPSWQRKPLAASAQRNHETGQRQEPDWGQREPAVVAEEQMEGVDGTALVSEVDAQTLFAWIGHAKMTAFKRIPGAAELGVDRSPRAD